MDSIHKAALRTAVLIHERLIGSKCQDLFIPLPEYYWHRLENLQRQIELARQRGWHLAAAGSEPDRFVRQQDLVPRDRLAEVKATVNDSGRFPDVDGHLPQADAAKARCSLSQSDADFLIETLPRLPCNDDKDRPVTLDLNGHVIVRAKGDDSQRPTEVLLAGSTALGEPLRVNTNRTYLARALRLGVRDLFFTDDQSAIFGANAGRHYVWMPLGPGAAIPPAEDSLRIESPRAAPVDPIPQPKPKRKIAAMNESPANPNGNGHAPTNGANGGERPDHEDQRPGPQGHRPQGRPAGHHRLDRASDQAPARRVHDLTYQASGLVKALKQQRRQSRAIQTTLASLRHSRVWGSRRRSALRYCGPLAGRFSVCSVRLFSRAAGRRCD